MFKELQDFTGKRAFITGAGRGIGLCCARALAEAGASVTISDQNEELLQEGLSFLRGLGFEVDGHALDVADQPATEALADRLGTFDVLIANAGIAWPDTAAEDLSPEAWRRLMSIDLDGAFWTCQSFGKRMIGRGGAIVTVGSMSGMISNKPQRQVHYNAAKAGLHHLTQSLAGEWAEHGIRVNAVAPTYVNTPMSNISAKNPELYDVWMEGTPMRRMVEPEEVAAAITFLASRAASGITGTVLKVDAGYTIW